MPLIAGMVRIDSTVLADLDPSNLIALHHLLEERHVTRAAKRLGISQSSMSHRLRRLREVLGDPLFVLAKGELVATPRADAIRAPLRAALEALEAAVAAPRAFEPRTARHTLSVALPDLLAPLLPALLHELRASAPLVDLRIESVAPDLGDALTSGVPALALAPVGFVDERIIARSLGVLRFGVAVRKGHPLLARPLTTARWLSYPHVVVQIGNERANVVGDAIARSGFVRRVGLVVPSFLAGLFAVARSDLVMNVPMPLVTDVVETLDLVGREAPIALPRVPFAMLWHERFQNDPAHRWAREVVFAAVRARFSRPR